MFAKCINILRSNCRMTLLPSYFLPCSVLSVTYLRHRCEEDPEIKSPWFMECTGQDINFTCISNSRSSCSGESILSTSWLLAIIILMSAPRWFQRTFSNGDMKFVLSCHNQPVNIVSESALGRLHSTLPCRIWVHPFHSCYTQFSE